MFVLSHNISILRLFKKAVLTPLLISLFLIGCGRESENVTNADTPLILAQPESATYVKDDSAAPLDIVADVTDGGVLSYQWFASDTSDIEDGVEVANTITYTPPTNEIGVKYYYVKVTNTNENVAGNKTAFAISDVAVITVNDPMAYAVRFYNDSLSFLHMEMLREGIINPAAVFNGVWYKAGDSTRTSSHNLTGNISFYAAPFVIEVTNQEELNNIRYKLDGKYILMNDIVLSDDEPGFAGFGDSGWDPIRTFTGIFNGNSYVISNLWINRPIEHNVGLFGYVDAAKIKNLGVTIKTDKEVKAEKNVGGIVGYMKNSQIANSYLDGSVVSLGGGDGGSVGGIAGYMEENSQITNSYSTGSVSSAMGIAGGIAGLIGSAQLYAKPALPHGQVTNSYSSSNINPIGQASAVAAGIVGMSTYTIIDKNVAINPSVRGSSDAGPVAGLRSIPFDGGPYDGRSASFSLNSMLLNGVLRDNIISQYYPYGYKKSEEELKTRSTYEDDLGWSFGDNDTHPWKININKNNGLPYLYWEKR
ncbi:MAG: hypothetical protein LBJ88_04040 [Campylobacteraceae bacterium]|jgi:hypothetical protein|nr:hypothetical protein [Campylobacteraceae bacterium]